MKNDENRTPSDEVTPDEKITIRQKVQKFLESGNPPSFLKKIGVLNLEGKIDFKRARAVLATIASNEEEIKATLEAAGYEIRKRQPEDTGENGIIIT